MATDTLPPPPAGYTLIGDGQQLPPPPAGYTLIGDGQQSIAGPPVGISSEGRPIYRAEATAKAPSWIERVAGAVERYAKNLAHDLNPVKIAGDLGAAVEHPLDTATGLINAQGAEGSKAVDSFRNGDYLLGIRHTLAYLLPLIGPQMEQIAEQADTGDVAGALGRATALAGQTWLGGKVPQIVEGAEGAVRAAPGAIRTAAPVVKGAVKGGLSAAADTKNMVGAGAAELAAEHLFGLPRGAGAAAVAIPRVVRGAYQGAKAAMPGAAAAAEEAAMLDKIAEGLAGQKFAELTPDAQAAVRTVYQRIQNPAATPSPETPRPIAGPIEDFPPGPNAAKTLAEMVDEDLAARRAVKAGVNGLPPRQAEPGAPPMDTAPVAAPATTEPPPPAVRAPSEAAVQPAPARSIEDLSRELNALLAGDAAPAVEKPKVDFAASRRAIKAPAIAQYLHEAGASAEEVAQTIGSDAAGEFWEAAAAQAGAKAGKNFGTPSIETQRAIVDEMRRLEGSAQPAASEPAAVNGNGAKPIANANVEDAAALARTLHNGGNGITVADANLMSPGAWRTVAKQLGLPEPSAATIQQARAELARLEQAAPYARGLAEAMGAEDMPPHGTSAAVRGPVDVRPMARPKSLTAPQVTARALDQVARHGEELLAEYQRRFGNVLNADNAAELFPDYAASVESRTKYRDAVHLAAQWVRDELFNRALKDPDINEVVFTAGALARESRQEDCPATWSWTPCSAG